MRAWASFCTCYYYFPLPKAKSKGKVPPGCLSTEPVISDGLSVMLVKAEPHKGVCITETVRNSAAQCQGLAQGARISGRLSDLNGTPEVCLLLPLASCVFISPYILGK